MAKLKKDGTIKMTMDELYNACHRFYYEGATDQSTNCANDGGVKYEFARLTKEITE